MKDKGERCQTRVTTERPCLVLECGHGASAHKVRWFNYAPYRAECEMCNCAKYVDPAITQAAHYNDHGERVQGSDGLRRMNSPAMTMTTKPIRCRPVKNIVEQRAYWRQKQRESRERRRLEQIHEI